MKSLTSFVLLLALSLGLISLYAQTPDYEKLKSEAEASYAEGSYARAYESYVQAGALNLSPAQKRWVDFRQADTLWRSQAATQTADTTKLDQARHQLEVLVRDIERPEDRDQVWVEVQESLGDFWWSRRNQSDWGQAWPHYQLALDWWAGSADIESARDRYLKLVWKMTHYSGAGRFYSYGNYGFTVPLDILENALKIAKTENDKAHAHYLVAMTLRMQATDTNQRRRIPEEFEGAIRSGNSSEWYDDALYQYAQWLETNGRVTVDEEGQEKNEPDYVRALELYRRLVNEYQKGESRYYEGATQQIKNITNPSLGVFASNFFLPGSEIQFNLNWRNVKKIGFDLYKVDLTRDVEMGSGEWIRGWIQSINLDARQPLKSWSRETEDKGDYRPGSEVVRLDSKLPVGAYVLKASTGKVNARDLILVTDTSLVLKTTSKQALVYFCNALNGAPIAEASVSLWESSYDYQSRMWISKRAAKQTNAEGIAVFDVTANRNNVQLFVSAINGERQAFSLGNSYSYGRQDQPWRIYAFTDRPAYRPKEKAHWKLIARQYNGSVYSTPANQTLEFQISDPRGSKVKEGKITLNAFGSAWGSLELTDAMPLGVYRVTFWDVGRKTQIGSDNLLRLEEYKLPEFKVTVQTPEENGKKKSFRVGESVEVNIQADYYFGGPVSDASVEVLVHQNLFYHGWYRPHDFPWYYEDMTGRSLYYGGRQGQVIKHETLKTDATGKASLTFETPHEGQQDYEYYVEARVTDASRREIEGSGTIRVTRQRYYIYPQAQHNLYRPQDKVSIDVKALDANEQPVQAEGTVKVTRDYWYEIWIDPTGKEVKGEELTSQRRRWPIFPPPPDSSGKSWRFKFRGYQHEDLLKQTLKTDAEGKAELTFTPAREGYYQIAWGSRDKDGTPIKAQTTVWVCKNSTTEIGYRHDGVEIIADKDTFHVGQKAPVLLNVPTNDRYVLFSIEGDDLYSYQLVHVTGTVKLIEIPIEEKHVPNIFLSATMVNEGQISLDTKQVVVPPVQQFLTVDVKADREQYQPREEGTLQVTTRTYDGKPIAAEVGLGLVDESVYYIQQDYARDPRQFFYGTKRYNYIQNQSTFSQKSFTKLVEGPNKELVDERQLAREGNEEINAEFGAGGGRGVAGGMVGGVVAGLVSKNGRMDIVSRSGPNQFERLQVLAQVSRPAEMKMKVEGALSTPAAAPMQAGPEPAVQVRTDFRATVFWQPDVVTDKDGKATVKVKFPDSLTTWKATARVESAANQFGIASSTTRTQQPLIVRLQAPRFFLVGDQVTISAVINNNTDKPMTVTPSLDAQGVVVTGIVVNGSPVKGEQAPVQVPANGEARADWVVSVQKPGEAKLKVTGRGGAYADAMEKTFPVYEHGIEKFIAKSGKMRGDEVTVKLDIPKERKPGSTVMTVQVAPSMAVTMLDALPYLIDYPYGCTEQTMSRFLPTVVVAKTLKDLGLRPELVMGKLFGGVEQQFATQTHPDGSKDLHLLDEITQQSLKRLYDFQHSDGGWGWWKDGDTDPFMTAYIVWGLTLARDAGIKLKPEVLDRGVDYLQKTLVEQELNYDLQAWMLHAVSTYHHSMKLTQLASPVSKAFDNLWKNRDQLNAYTRALLALSANHLGYMDQAKTLIRNLENGVKIDNRPDISIIQKGGQSSEKSVIPTAHWGEDGIYWRWSDGGVEATSFALRALLAIDPQNKLVEPVTNWLVKNRRGAQWNSTRDTAITVLSLTDYLRSSGELRPEVEYELSVNGHAIVTRKVTPDDALTAPSQFPVDAKDLVDGANEIRLKRKSGNSPLYFSVQTRYFSLEEPIPAAGNEIFVRRQYYKLVGHPTLLKGYVYDRQPLNDGESVTSGDRVQTVLTIEAKNNYEYLVFEDLKPAGLEAVQIRSGEPMYAKELKSSAVEDQSKVQGPKSKVENTSASHSESSYTGRTRWVYQELRDRKVALFIDKLPQGVWEIRYDLRAEAPGHFHALPTLGYAMYVPEIRTNGSEVRITVEDRKEERK
jgi:uncharacterized protein YfaS (alpha-2-macroglobulin family)